MADRYVGNCFICGVGIDHHDHKDATNEHYIVLPLNSSEMELPEADRPKRLVRCDGCVPGSPSWMDSEIGKASPMRKYFEMGQELRQERRVRVTAQKSSRPDSASPLLKSFAGRIRYLIHMANVAKDVIPWKLELVDAGRYYMAEVSEDGALVIEAHGIEVPFEPKNTLTDRLNAAAPKA